MNRILTRFGFILLISISLISCQTKTERTKRFLSSIEYSTEFKNAEIIYVSPVMGCKSCILKLLDIYELYSTQTKSFWVFSGFNKLKAKTYFLNYHKDLKYKMDLNKGAYKYEILTTEHPIILFCANQKVIEHVIVYPNINFDLLHEKIDRFILDNKKEYAFFSNDNAAVTTNLISTK